MTPLAALMATCTDAVLIAASSKGVVLRATKDVGAGKVAVLILDADKADLRVEDATVSLRAKALAASQCSCAASGVCRHIVAAVIFLRASQEPGPPPAQTLAQTPMADLAAFAGSDWPDALAMARGDPVIDGETVTFPSSGDQVTFPPGRPLTDALYKGPSPSRRKRAIVAAALALAVQAGRDLPSQDLPPDTRQISADLLDQVQEALQGAVLALAAGNVAQSRDRLFTAAIATRIEAIPRLAAALRSLCERLEPDALRRADYSPPDALADIARAYALAEALRSAPDDTALTGVLARTYRPSGPRRMATVGADVWRSPTGARGMTVILVDLETGRFHLATDARGAGTDLTFEPMQSLRTSLWFAGSPLDLMGRCIAFDDAHLSQDGALSLSQRATAQGGIDLAQLDRAGAVMRNWQGLASTITSALGQGLRRRFGAAHVILAPHRTENPQADPYDQVMKWRWWDKAGHAIDLTLPEMPGGLRGQENHALAGLVALDHARQGRLMSLWISGATGPFALPFQPLPEIAGWKKMWDLRPKLRQTAPRQAVSRQARLQTLLSRALETILLHLGGTGMPWPEELLAEAETLGLSRIAALMRSFSAQRSPALALQTAYALSASSEIAASLPVE